MHHPFKWLNTATYLQSENLGNRFPSFLTQKNPSVLQHLRCFRMHCQTDGFQFRLFYSLFLSGTILGFLTTPTFLKEPLKKRPNVSLIAFLHNIQFYTKLISNDLHTNSFSLIGLWFSLTQNVRLVQSP